MTENHPATTVIPTPPPILYPNPQTTVATQIIDDLESIKILILVGMAGSGKSTVVSYLADRLPAIYFGGMIYREMNSRGIEITPVSQQIFREQLRAERGEDVLARLAIDSMLDLFSLGHRRFVVDGLYSWPEYCLFHQAFPGRVAVVATVAPKHVRYARLANRPERPFTLEESAERDRTEIENLSKGGPIAAADYFLDTNRDQDSVLRELQRIFVEIRFFT